MRICSDTILGDYAYIQTSLKIDKDIRLLLVNVNDIPTQLHRTVTLDKQSIKYMNTISIYIYILSVYIPFFDRVGFPHHNKFSPRIFIKSPGAKF